MSKLGFGGGGWEQVDHTRFRELAANKAVATRGVREGVGFGLRPTSRTRFTLDAPMSGRVVQIPLPDFTGRVLRGMGALDENAPGWQDEIDTSTLDLFDPDRCVLGQTWPHYQRLAERANRVILIHRDPDPACDIPWRYYPIAADNGFLNMQQAIIPGDRLDQAHWAASIGCTLDDSDYELGNVTAKKLVHDMLGEVESRAAHQAASEIAIDIFRMFFEELTRTWLREISRARQAGRWSLLPSRPLPPQRTLLEVDRPPAVAERARELLRA